MNYGHNSWFAEMLNRSQRAFQLFSRNIRDLLAFIGLMPEQETGENFPCRCRLRFPRILFPCPSFVKTIINCCYAAFRTVEFMWIFNFSELFELKNDCDRTQNELCGGKTENVEKKTIGKVYEKLRNLLESPQELGRPYRKPTTS